MSKVDDYLRQIVMQKRLIDEALEDPALDNTDFVHYNAEKKELEDIRKLLVGYRDKTSIPHKNNGPEQSFMVLPGGKL